MNIIPARIVSFLASPTILFYALPWLIALVVAGTVTQPALGLYEAVHAFLQSWIIWSGPLPLPGGLPTLTLITANLLAKFLFRSEWHWAKAGLHLTHVGVLVLLLGGLVTTLNAREGYMIIPEGRQSADVYAYDKGEIRITPPSAKNSAMIWGTKMETLPFVIALRDFVRENYPGTDRPKRYYSEIEVVQNARHFPARIAMNDPLRLHGYTIYQSSFLDVGDHQATVLQVVHNRGRLFPYVAMVLMLAGLALHIVLKARRL